MSWRPSIQLLTSPSSNERNAACPVAAANFSIAGKRQGGDVALARQRLAKASSSCKTRRGEHRIDEGRIVLGKELEGIAGLVGRRRAVEAEREMDRLLVGARRVQVDVLDDLGEHRLAADLDRGARSRNRPTTTLPARLSSRRERVRWRS